MTVQFIFSKQWYRDKNPDVGKFSKGALAHYLAYGWREKRTPHPLFDTQWYSEQTATDQGPTIEPVTHYLTTGWRSLKSPHPIFNPAWYLQQNPDILAADLDPWWHYLQKGWQEGRTLHPLFDTKWYLAQNPDLAKSGTEPLAHFLHYGWREGRAPHPLFDMDWYSSEYALDTKTNPWLHYVLKGWREGCSPHPMFDAYWYQNAYLDPAVPVCEPLNHYLTTGWKEGLLPHEDFDINTPTSGSAAPLYEQLTSSTAPLNKGLRAQNTRGHILMVTHDTQIGGAPRVLKLFADWVQSSTRFSVGIVAIKGGAFLEEFKEIAPVIVLSDYAEEDRTAALSEWAGDDVQATFVNSVASGSFYKYWEKDTPSVAFIHELTKVLDMYSDEVGLIHTHANHVVCGGPDVLTALRDTYHFPEDRLTGASSFIEALPQGDTDADRQARRIAARKAMNVPDDRVLVMGCGVAHWRKSPDKVVETAIEVLAKGIDAEFIWLGGGRDEKACIEQAKEAGIENRITFAGYEPDVAGKLAGADIFLLSSQEDPFPLVALYAAQAGAPIVCFQDAGGIANFVQTGSGTAVPFMDIQAMAKAVQHYAQDATLRSKAGAIGMHQVATTHTINAVGPMLLHHLRNVAGLAPEVSVVLPNYNYEAYLPERLDSIVAQQFQDFEIILLDDASTDQSEKVLRDFAAKRVDTSVLINTENSGSPFVQWMRGMDMAKSDIIWLAEADDYCEPNLLTTLLPLFDDRNMRIASCMSVPVQSDGTVIGDYRPIYLDRIAPGRFDRSFIVTDHEEANQGLGIANTIPNASGVLFRRFDPEPDFVEKVTAMHLCGDWFFYTRAMKGGLVGFSNAPLNYHRRHGGTVTHKLEGSLRYFGELADVRAYLGHTYVQDDAARERIQEFLAQDIARFKIKAPETLPQAPTPLKILPSLLVVAPDLSPGGGQMFAISLANEWAARGGRAVLLNAGYQPTHPAVLTKLDTGVALYHSGDPGADLNEIVQRYDIDVIHSSIWWADAMVDNYCDQLPEQLPWIISMHGCHETFIKHPDIDPSFPKRMNRMLKRASAWVYTADKNLAIFDDYPRPETLLRIPNGMREEPVRHVLDREALGLRKDAIVLCLASRAITSKGWGEAIALTQTLNANGHKVDLMLIGEGPAADAARADAPAHVHLMGQVSNLQDYFAISDIGLLPSYFVGESLPLVLIEMMAKGLPLIATQIGEIPDIVGTGDGAAGLLVPLKDDGLDMDALVAAAQHMLAPAVRTTFGTNARARFDAKYRLDQMVDRYAKVYEKAGALDG